MSVIVSLSLSSKASSLTLTLAFWSPLRQFYNEYYSGLGGVEGFSLGPILSRPKSRGNVTLVTTNPFQAPRITTNYFSHPDDMRVFIRGESANPRDSACIKYNENDNRQ